MLVAFFLGGPGPHRYGAFCFVLFDRQTQLKFRVMLALVLLVLQQNLRSMQQYIAPSVVFASQRYTGQRRTAMYSWLFSLRVLKIH